MKKYLFTLLAVIASICGCDDTGTQPTGEIQMASSSKDVLTIKPEGGKENVRFSSALEWHIEFSDEWLTVDPMEGGPGTAKITIDAEANETAEDRQAIVYICTGDLEYPVTVNQKAFVPTFELLETEKDMSCLGGELVISVYTDVEYEFSCEADWVKSEATKAPRTRKVVFTVDPNTTPESRKAIITFCAGTTCQAFTLTQRPAGTEGDDWKYEAFVHRSLAMRFTATWCGYCPMMGSAFDMAKNQLPGQLEIVSLHGSDSDYQFSGTTNLAKRFNVSSFPTGIVDARASIPNYSTESATAAAVFNVVKETQEAYPTKSSIACKSSLNGTDLTVDLSLYFKETDEYKVTVLLMEDGIVGYQNGASGKYTHNDVARLAVTSISGDAVSVTDAPSVWSKTYTATVKSSWNPENLELLIYVEKPYGDQGKAKGVSSAKYGNYGDTYIDNCRVVKVGEEVAVELK